MIRRSVENPRQNQYRHMIPLMQVGPFFPRERTFRNFLPAAAGVHHLAGECLRRLLELSCRIHNSSAFSHRVGIGLTLQYLLVTFPQRLNFFAPTLITEARQTGTMAFVAKKIFLTKGVGKHRERLSSFELALRNAGIAACNIVRVSSIFPPNCKLISRSEGLKHMKPGQVAFTVISENSTKEAHRLIAASIGLALPSDKSMYGYLSEHHSFGETEEVAGEYAEELAAEMLATTLNVEFDPDLSFDEKKEVYRISNKIVRTMNVTQSAVGDKRGLWTTVL